MSVNLKRINSLVQRSLANILHNNVDQNITITHVDVAPGLTNAKVFVSILDETKQTEIIKELNKEASVIQHELAHSTKLRRTPKLCFIYDESILRGAKLSQLIDKV